MSPKPIYKRILLKLSGEALQGQLAFGIDPKELNRLTKEIVELIKLKVQVGLVVGGGNIFRGGNPSVTGIARITGDQIGMLATVINALALRDAFESMGVTAVVMSAISASGFVEPFNQRKAISHMQKGSVVIFAGGTGNPLVTTDSAASLRGIEIEAEILLKATRVDGIYSADPAKHKDAKLYQHVSYQEALDKQLGVMDLSAFCQCRDNKLAIRVFDISKPGILTRIVTGSDEGTLVN